MSPHPPSTSLHLSDLLPPSMLAWDFPSYYLLVNRDGRHLLTGMPKVVNRSYGVGIQSV